MLITSMLHIGLPYILKIVMETSDRLYGYLFEIYRDTTQYIIIFSLILGVVLVVLLYFIARKNKR